MKTDVFLIIRYWTHNKKQLFKLLLSIILLVTVIIVTNLCEITECRRKYDDIKRSYNACNIVLEYLSDEEYETISNYPEVDKIARVFTYGKLGNQSVSFAYGCYENKLAEELDYLELSYGRLPEKSGETAIYEYALLEMFPNIEIEEMLNKEIELSDYDLNGNNIGIRKLQIVGIINNGNGNRNLIESCQWCDKALVPVPMPMIFLSRDDLKEYSTEYNFALITHNLSEYETDESHELYTNIVQKSGDAFQKYQIGSDGLAIAACGVMDYQANNKMYEKVYDTDTTLLIRNFSVIAAVISAISLFGVLYSVISERIKSLKLIKTLGYSNLRMIRLLINEWMILYLIGLIIGIIVGYGFYEIILLLQKNIGHLPALQAINAEWAVRQVTVSPFGIAFICSIITFFLGYVFFIVKAFIFDRKRSKKREKCRSFGKIKRRKFGDKFTNVVQVISFSLIIITATMFYSIFTLNGKGNGNPYLTRPELSGEEYYQYGHINMKNDGFDVCIYSEYSESSTGP